MTKRKVLLATIREYAKDNNLELRVSEGANHTRVWVGDKYTTVPRHNDIPDLLARRILKQIGAEK
ncbi:toxin HicA [Arcanobacterium haemolyticum]|nr:toxin HicA [Arcanobacterium haemolyticum]